MPTSSASSQQNAAVSAIMGGDFQITLDQIATMVQPPTRPVALSLVAPTNPGAPASMKYPDPLTPEKQ